MFVPHALLLRGALYSLWREDEKGLKDLQSVINIQGLTNQVISMWAFYFVVVCVAMCVCVCGWLVGDK